MWDGVDRRTNRFCSGHIEFSNMLARIEERIIAMDKRINGTIGDFKAMLDSNRPRNIAIGGALLSIIVYLFVFSYGLGDRLGEYKKQIEVNTKRLERLEKIEVIAAGVLRDAQGTQK